jgi:DNA-directed RNA polymerase alpha subunit
MNISKSKQAAPYSMRLREDLKNRLLELAVLNERSLSGQIHFLLTAALRESHQEGASHSADRKEAPPIAAIEPLNPLAVEFEETIPEELKKRLHWSVEELDLSARCQKLLDRANITTVGQLTMKTEGEMLKYRNLGKRSLEEIKDRLSEMGLGFGMNRKGSDTGLVGVAQ